ncbi:MAG: hypothetical protein IJU70_12670 [Lentisphaeria bacterium]|nr:hypothetical protein [Lentisphaeria bacterium]
MIPSDHFVRFYNEVFKYLDENRGLEPYYARISRHQEFHCLEGFRTNGLRGVYDYYVKIRKEENCDMDLVLNDGELILRMNRCPSLTKAIDNDAGACEKYCLHCPGWTLPLYSKAGLFQVYDLVSLNEPRCCEWIYERKEKAEMKYGELLKIRPESMLRKNF